MSDNNSNKIFPQHIAIVPDGNRRWARAKGQQPWQGHIEGAKRSEELAEAALDMDLKCFSMWAGSSANLTKRSKKEIKFLFDIYEKYFKKLFNNKKIYDYKVKVNIIGKWQNILPNKTAKAAQDLVDATKNHSYRYLNILVSYSGIEEMTAMIKNVLRASKEKNLTAEIDAEMINNYLWTGELPPVDLLIRTGSFEDPHNSAGFMMWKCANSQLYFSRSFFPDFGKSAFKKAIKEYQRRERRLGK